MDKTICVFGDSTVQAAYIQEGWVDLLRQYLEEKYPRDFVNVYKLGIGGNTSDDILHRFASEAQSRAPTAIIFAFGVNDSGYFKVLTRPIVPARRFTANLRSLITQAKKFCPDITFIGPALGDDSLLQPFPGSSRGKTYVRGRTEDYNRILEKTVTAVGCRFINLLDQLQPADFQDGLHPNDHGHRRIFETIKNHF